MTPGGWSHACATTHTSHAKPLSLGTSGVNSCLLGPPHPAPAPVAGRLTLVILGVKGRLLGPPLLGQLLGFSRLDGGRRSAGGGVGAALKPLACGGGGR